MTRLVIVAVLFAAVTVLTSQGKESLETDVIPTSQGDLSITFIGHGTLMFQYGGKVIHVDPYGKVADYTKFPKADVILITHEHSDHLDQAALSKITTGNTTIVLTEICAQKLKKGTVMHNGETKNIAGLKIEAVPAYNLVHMRDTGQPFHPKGSGRVRHHFWRQEDLRCRGYGKHP